MIEKVLIFFTKGQAGEAGRSLADRLRARLPVVDAYLRRHKMANGILLSGFAAYLWAQACHQTWMVYGLHVHCWMVEVAVGWLGTVLFAAGYTSADPARRDVFRAEAAKKNGDLVSAVIDAVQEAEKTAGGAAVVVTPAPPDSAVVVKPAEQEHTGGHDPLTNK